MPIIQCCAFSSRMLMISNLSSNRIPTRPPIMNFSHAFIFHSLAAKVAILLCSVLSIGSAAAQTVTFRVDMAVQSSIERFEAENDFVQVRGSFNGWGGTDMELMEGSESVYEAEIEIFDDPGTTIEYKFFVASAEFGDVWEENVGSGHNGNRGFDYEEGGQVLDTVFFNNLDTDPGAGIEVTFQVNMALLIEDESFLPDVDVLEARGAFNGWQGGFELEPISEGSTIYHGTTEIDNIASGSPVEYKYVYNGSAWEDGGNRTFDLAEESPQILPPRYFNDIGPDSALTEDTEILFTVDMNGAEEHDGPPFDPENDQVFINGVFAQNTWWDWDNPPFDFELKDDGETESGDAIAGDGIYSIKFEAFEGDPKKAEYKYSINGADNEAGFQDNHVRYIRDTESYAFPRDTFGEMIREPEELPMELGSINISGPVDGMVTVTWENPVAILQRSQSMMNDSWIEVPDSQGQGEMMFPVDDPASEYFRLATPTPQ